jgi:hypothetical protein
MKTEQKKSGVPLLAPSVFAEIIQAIVKNAERDLRQAREIKREKGVK